MKIIDINGNMRDCFKAYADPSYPGYMKIEYKNTIRSYSDWYPIKEFISNNPTLEHLTTSAAPTALDDLGVVAKSSPLTLKDSSKRWQTNIYADFPVWISRGKGEGQTRKVTSNTHNVLTIDKEWDILPDESSQYVLSHNIHDPQVLGNTLPTEEIDVSEIKSMTIKLDMEEK